MRKYHFREVKVVNTGRTRFKKGNVPINKGTGKPKPKCPGCGKEMLGKGNPKTCRKCVPHTWGEKIGNSLRGKPNLKHKGKLSPLWKDGVTPENNKIRSSIEYKQWSREVMKRDNFTCQKYGTKGGKLVAHHILNFSNHEDLRFDINNGITLSQKAHNEFHKKYDKKNNTREQLIEFLNKTI